MTAATAEQFMADYDLDVLPPLTEKQEILFRYLARYWQENRYMPTQREMCEAMSVKSSNAQPYIVGLEKKGYLTRVTGRRNIRITDKGAEKLQLMGQSVTDQQSLFEEGG